MNKIQKFALTLGILFFAVYIAGSVVFSVYAYPILTYNNRDYGLVKLNELDSLLKASLTGKIGFLEKSGKFVIEPQDIAYNVTVNNVDYRQNGFAWPFELYREHAVKNVDYDVTYDKALLQGILEKQYIRDPARIKSTDAVLLKKDMEYVIVPEVTGNTFNSEKLLSYVAEKLDRKLRKIDLSSADLYIKPEVYRSNKELIDTLNLRNVWRNTRIRLLLNDEKITVLDVENPYGFKTSDETDFMAYNEKLADKIAADLVAKYDTAHNFWDFTTTAGKKVRIEPGTLGISLDKDTIRSLILDSVSRGNVEDIEVPMSGIFTGHTIGDSYVEIDLTKQKLWLYKNGKLITTSDIVSGLASSERRATPAGAFYVLYQMQDTNLVGTVPGDEYSSFVNYWMPFTNEGHGLHDALWRGAFGGEDYLYDGSHGCVNLPFESAEKIYETIDAGYPVIIYKS